MDEEKKVKLEDLLNSEDLPIDDQPSRPIRPPKKINLPESQLLLKEAKLGSEKLRMLEQTWYFDRPISLWGWLYASVFVTILCLVPVREKFNSSIRDDDPINIPIFAVVPEIIVGLSEYAWVLFFVIPLFFKFKKESSNSIKISLSGIETVRKVDFVGNETINKLFIKWDDIVGAEIASRKNRKIISLNLKNDQTAEMIWDFKYINKLVFKKVLLGLVDKKHPLRVLVEKDLE